MVKKMTRKPKKDGRRNNGRTRTELLKFSKEGKVSVKHDGFGFLSRGFALPNDNCVFYPDCGCKKRCLAIDKLAEDMEIELMSLPHIEDCDLFLVRQFVKLMIFQVVVDRYLEKHGILIEKGGDVKLQPVFSEYFMLTNSLQRLADRLGLSPVGRKQLRSKGKLKDLAALIAEHQDKK